MRVQHPKRVTSPGGALPGTARSCAGAVFEVPSTDDLDALYERVKNWGRWGSEDECGTLNLLTMERKVAAAALVAEGITVSLAHDLVFAPTAEHPSPAEHRMLADGEHARALNIPGYEACRDYVGTDIHGTGLTHVDALSHMFVGGLMYNGLPLSLVTDEGATRNSVMALAPGVAGRGVLLDIPAARGVAYLEPGDAVGVEDLLAAEQAQAVVAGEGDMVIILTGRDALRAARGRPLSAFSDGMSGLHPECLEWIHERQPAILGSDGISDRIPMVKSEKWPFPIHQIGITAMGLHLVDSMRLDELAATCSRLGRWSFLMVIAALRIPGGTGSPVNPIAFF